MQTLSFYTTGEAFTELLNTFFDEGRFKAVYDILVDSGLSQECIKMFFMGNCKFEGDTRKSGTLNFIFSDEIDEQSSSKRLYWAIINCINGEEIDEVLTKSEFFKNKNLTYLDKVISRKQVISMIYKNVLEEKGFEINPDAENENVYRNGAILRNGTYITCGYTEHSYLYPILRRLGLANSNDWTDDDITIHVSGGTVGGDCMNTLQRSYDGKRVGNCTDEQIATLIKYRKSITNIYGERNSLMESIREFVNAVENYGGKYNNLLFLSKYYPTVNLPKFSKKYINGIKKQCIRTSPKYSLPGLLESKFHINKNSVSEIEETFGCENHLEKYKDVREGNELHYFYQEFLEGKNGVCSIINKKFQYAVSSKQHEIVQGKISLEKLDDNEFEELESICKYIYDDIDEDLQFEFVISNCKVYIVQMRRLENSFERTILFGKPENVIAEGITFSKGRVVCKPDDILIIDSDCKPELLLNKKALVVKSHVQFSHILALSQSLKIPSLFNTGEIDLSKYDEVEFRADNETGYIRLPL